ncbi:MAG: hypothetical protein E7321_03780 [Clostridiales bacterium]|nr:hypothetical protein [Clostridiales bacterium]
MKKITLLLMLAAMLLVMTGCTSMEQALGKIGDDIEARQLEAPKTADTSVDWSFVPVVRELASTMFTEGVPGATITNTRVASKDNKGERTIVIIEYELDGKTGSYGFDYEKDENGEYELKRLGEGVRTDDLM